MRTFVHIAAIIAVAGVVRLHTWATPNQPNQMLAGATGQADLLTAAPGETIKMDIKLTPHKK